MPVDMNVLDVLLNKVRDEQGFCLIPDRLRPTIRSKRIDCVNGAIKYDPVHWVVERYEDRYILRVVDGVTGWESWEINHLLSFGLNGKDAFNFCACAGTRGRYDELWLNGADVWDVIQGAIALHPDLF